MHSIYLLQVINRREALEHLGLSSRTLERLDAKREGPPKIRLSPGRIGYRTTDLDAWINARRESVA